MQLALAEARGNPDEIRRAQIAVDKQAASLEEAKDKTQDLQQESDEAAKKGVDGSEAVIDAKKRERDAQRAVSDAVEQHRLALQQLGDAQKSLKEKLDTGGGGGGGGGGGLGVQLPKIAKSAQDFLNALKRLKPAFEALRLDVQEHLFKNLDKTVTQMWNAWEHQLHVTLDSFADTFNRFARNLGSAVSTPKFIKDIATGAEGFRQMLEKIGKSVTTSLVPAFGALSSAAGPFLSALGDELAGVVTEFSNWILQAEKTGKLQTFMEKASETVHELFTTGKLAFKIVGDIVRIILGADQQSDKSALDSFNDALQKVHEWLQDPKNQARLRQLIADVKDSIARIGQLATKVSGFFNGMKSDNSSKDAGNWLGKMLIAGIVAGMAEGIRMSGDAVMGLFKEGSKFSLLGIITGVLGINSPSTVMMDIGRNLIEGLIIGMQQKMASLGAAARNIKTTVVNGVKSAGSWIYGQGQQVSQGMGNGIVSMFRNLGITSSNMRVPVYNGIAPGALGLLYGAGQNLGYGLINGINSVAGQIGATAARVANSVASTLNSIFQNRSPSKLTFGIGRYVGQGLALGINHSTADVEAAAARLAMAAIPAVDSLADGLQGQLTAAANGTVQVQAANRRQEVLVKFDITGADSAMKRVFQKGVRTQNYLQTA